MTDGFQVTVTDDAITVVTEEFTLVFDRDKIGVTEFRYEAGEAWHNGVESEVPSPILFGPYFEVKDLGTGFLYPDGGTDMELTIELDWFIEIYQTGWLRNTGIPECTDFPVEAWWKLWPSGRLIGRAIVRNQTGDHILVLEEAWRLNPADDADITLGRDEPAGMEWFGFYSNNTGSGEDDLSHDAIAFAMQGTYEDYGTSGNTNYFFNEDVTWADGTGISGTFMIVLSGNGSWGDIEDAGGFQTRGDEISADVRNPDPIDGSANAGEVIVGIRLSGGFDHYLGAYIVEAV
jgi:hypothetical protein